MKRKRTDKQRLNWLTRHDWSLDCDRTDTKEKWFYKNGWFKTVRQAIDSAIDAEAKGE